MKHTIELPKLEVGGGGVLCSSPDGVPAPGLPELFCLALLWRSWNQSRRRSPKSARSWPVQLSEGRGEGKPCVGITGTHSMPTLTNLPLGKNSGHF